MLTTPSVHKLLDMVKPKVAGIEGGFELMLFKVELRRKL